MAKFGELNVQCSMIKIQFSMKKIVIAFYFLVLTFDFFGQTVTQKLQKAFTTFEKDSQLKHAISSFYVIDANTGQVVFDKNSQVGLAPASTQKIITSVTAFELLGKDYRYKTELGYDGEKEGVDMVKGNLFVIGSGDPSLGSWRWKQTSEEVIINQMLDAIGIAGIKKFTGRIYADVSNWDMNQINDGWIWQDVGNYYGAGLTSLLWRENQFDVHLKSGKNIGDPVEIKNYTPLLYTYNYMSNLTSAKKGSGDNAYIYIQPRVIKGTIPVDENDFIISGAMPNGHFQFSSTLADSLSRRGFGRMIFPSVIEDKNHPDKVKYSSNKKILYTHYSPALDSIIYWFNKKSINLYGEALIKTFAYEKKGFGSTDSGVVVVKKFWKEKGLDEDELGIVDGSGLSPLNRVTTHAQVEILKYAKAKDWFPYFFTSLPEYNGMKIKSGTIRGVKGFCGYHKAKNGKEYIFSFLVNNYNGSSSTLVNKMYKVMDILK